MLQLRARAGSRRLDRDLVHDVVPWASPLHAARSCQLTSRWHRLCLGARLELLAGVVGDPARPLLLEAARTLGRSGPVDARGVARLVAVADDEGRGSVGDVADGVRSALDRLACTV